MTQPSASRFMATGLAIAICLGVASAVHAGEEKTIEAFASWQGEGKLVPMGPNPAVMVATLNGVVYIQTDQGPLRSGTIICPATAEVSLDDGKQAGRGRCAWTANDGDQVFAKWSCEGRLMIGCKGDYTLTGGTGRFEGVTGGGPIVFRSEIGTVAADASGQAIERATTGILYWPELKYTLP